MGCNFMVCNSWFLKYYKKKYLFSMEFFPWKIFHRKFWIFPWNLAKENFPLEIFGKRMDFTHSQLFYRKVDISNGFYRQNRNPWEIKISQFISRSVDFFAHLPLLPHLCHSQNVVFLPHSHSNPSQLTILPSFQHCHSLSSVASLYISLSHYGFVIYFCWTQEKVNLSVHIWVMLGDRPSMFFISKNQIMGGKNFEYDEAREWKVWIFMLLIMWFFVVRQFLSML